MRASKAAGVKHFLMVSSLVRRRLITPAAAPSSSSSTPSALPSNDTPAAALTCLPTPPAHTRANPPAQGTGKFGFPAALLNLFWEVLRWKKEAEDELVASGIPFTVIRCGVASAFCFSAPASASASLAFASP